MSAPVSVPESVSVLVFVSLSDPVSVSVSVSVPVCASETVPPPEGRLEPLGVFTLIVILSPAAVADEIAVGSAPAEIAANKASLGSISPVITAESMTS